MRVFLPHGVVSCILSHDIIDDIILCTADVIITSEIGIRRLRFTFLTVTYEQIILSTDKQIFNNLYSYVSHYSKYPNNSLQLHITVTT